MKECKCGCGKQVSKETNRYIYGHNLYDVNPNINKPLKILNLCKCGCGEFCKNKYVKGHYFKGKKRKILLGIKD